MVAILVILIMAWAFILVLYDEFEPVKATLIVVAIVIVAVGGYMYFVHSIDSNRYEAGSIKVKYRNDKVPVGGDSFESLGATSDSTVKNAWYDSHEEYLVVRLGSTNYHYCEVPEDVWDGLKGADAKYTYYQDYLRSNYDCRTYRLPAY